MMEGLIKLLKAPLSILPDLAGGGLAGSGRFESPWYLLLLVPLALLACWAYRRRQPSVSMPSIEPFAAMAPRRRLSVFSLPLFLSVGGIALLVVALARPQKGIEELIQRAEGIDIVSCLDLSGSMKAIDIPAGANRNDVSRAMASGKLKPRIEVAKEEIKKFIEKRPNDRIGLVVFAPMPYVACPPTLDHGWLFQHLDAVDAGVIGEATGIAGPLSSGVNRLKDSDSKRRVMVLFTDGRNNVNQRLTPLQAAKLGKTYNVAIYTVGIGSKSACILQKGMWGEHWAQLQDEFDEELLKKIADLTGGRYYKAADADGLSKAMAEIDKLEKTSFEQPRYIDYRELGPPLITASLVLLLLAFAAEHTVLLRIP